MTTRVQDSPCSRTCIRACRCICVWSRRGRCTCRWTRSAPPSSCTRRTGSSSSFRRWGPLPRRPRRRRWPRRWPRSSPGSRPHTRHLCRLGGRLWIWDLGTTIWQTTEIMVPPWVPLVIPVNTNTRSSSSLLLRPNTSTADEEREHKSSR